MTQSEVLAQAKQGDPQAIAQLMNRSLQSKGITAKVNRKEGSLRVLLESDQLPDQQIMIRFIDQGIAKLQVPGLETVQVYGQRSGQTMPAWSQTLNLIETNPSDDFVTDTASDISARQSSKIASDVSQNVTGAKLPQPKALIWLSRLLMTSLWVRLSLDVLFVVYFIVWATSYYVYNLLGIADATGFLASLINAVIKLIYNLWSPLDSFSGWVYLTALLLMLVWLHQTHARLKHIFQRYPISGGGAIARFVIPLYSLWGIWNIFTTLAEHLKSQGKSLAQRAIAIRQWLPWFYIALITSNLLDQVYRVSVRLGSEENLSSWFFVAKNGASLFLSIALLQMVQLTNKSVTELSNPQK
ncbi:MULTISPECIES: hypothetical protein [Trichocoleus]|uniref:DUF4328 domain-containing protein n=1 Tax=Trichocoleus desertorum GB2-A4 TaxID=2933944 RepID=A0ABV0J9N5_9CYAN|nr:hypothetical protein [Trichocoleus sp. FACHB-46]MBD1862823.1 hypothetical protein [Trichocoleus sp. FACHB-46]